MSFIARPPQPTNFTYNTSFPTAESPLSENGAWVDGSTLGGAWQNAQGAINLCITAQPTGYALANLVGRWGDDQTITSVIQALSRPSSGTPYESVGLLTRFTISRNNAVGYLVEWTIRTDGLNTVILTRFNGGVSQNVVLATVNPGVAVANGDTISMTCVGYNPVIKAFLNGVQVLSYDTLTGGDGGLLPGHADTNIFHSGSPGLSVRLESVQSSDALNFGHLVYNASTVTG